VEEHSVVPGTGASPRRTFRKSLVPSSSEGLELNQSDFVLNQPLVTSAENRGRHSVAGGPLADRAVPCKQNNAQVVDLHVRLTANGVLKDFADGEGFETNLSYLAERKREAVELGKTVLLCQFPRVCVCVF
jgi:hypothetical protein